MQDTSVHDSLGNAIVRLFRHVNREHNRALRKHGLSAEQVHVLTILWAEGAMPIGRLQHMLRVSSATITGTIDRMQRAELVHRTRDPDDGRTVIVEASQINARRKRAIRETLDVTEDALFGMLAPSERRTLLELARRVTL